MTEPSTRTLAAALDDLRSVAAAAGLQPEAAVREGEALAAAVGESAEQAYRDWCAQTGHPDPQSFFDAAHRGRRWRAAPTLLLGQLILTGHRTPPATPRHWPRSVAQHRRWEYPTPGPLVTPLSQQLLS